jgi:hypothetical protein
MKGVFLHNPGPLTAKSAEEHTSDLLLLLQLCASAVMIQKAVGDCGTPRRHEPSPEGQTTNLIAAALASRAWQCSRDQVLRLVSPRRYICRRLNRTPYLTRLSKLLLPAFPELPWYTTRIVPQPITLSFVVFLSRPENQQLTTSPLQLWGTNT